MPSKTAANHHQLPNSNHSIIQLDNGLWAFYDTDDADLVEPHIWQAVKWRKSTYARCNTGRPDWRSTMMMHRLVNGTPVTQVCHHRNRNSLDNRKANLINMDRLQHHELHANDTLVISYNHADPQTKNQVSKDHLPPDRST